MSSTRNVNDWAVCRQKRVPTLNLSKNSRACLPSARIPPDDGYLLVKQIIQKMSLVFVRIRRVNPPFQETTIPWWCRYKPQPCTAEVEATPLYWSHVPPEILGATRTFLATMVPCTPPEILLAPGAPNATRWNWAQQLIIRESVSISNEESEGKINSKNTCLFSRCHPRFSCRAPGKPSLVTAPSAGFGVTTSRQPLVDSPKWLLLVVCTEGGWLVISWPCRFEHFLVDLSHFMASPCSSDKPMLQSNYILWMHPIQIIQYAWKYAVGSFRYIDRSPTLISLESNKSLLATNLDLACFVVPFKSHPVLRTTAGRHKGWDKVKCHMVCHLFCVVILPRSGWINISKRHITLP